MFCITPDANYSYSTNYNHSTINSYSSTLNSNHKNNINNMIINKRPGGGLASLPRRLALDLIYIFYFLFLIIYSCVKRNQGCR